MFAICAYKNSPYLEACIRSVLGQNYPTKAIICTSTPSRFIEGLAKKYNLAISGGSDFHGANKPGLDLKTGYGSLFVPESILEQLQSLLS